MAKATASQKKSALAELCTISNPKVTNKAKDHDSHTEPQQPFRFTDLPPELRDMVYTVALCPEPKRIHFLGEDLLVFPPEPDLLDGLSNSATAQALSQVCRTIRQESMKAYYSKKNTFIVRGVPDPWGNLDPMLSNDYPQSRPHKSGCPPPPGPVDLWARTWGVLGAQHIRSLRVRPLGRLINISMTAETDPVSVVEGAYPWLPISVPEVKAAASKAFGTSLEGSTAAWKLNRFLCEIGTALRAARYRRRQKSCPQAFAGVSPKDDYEYCANIA